MKLPENLSKKYENEKLFSAKRESELINRDGQPSNDEVRLEVRKIISKRANLDLKYFTDTDILTKQYLEFTPRRLQALTITLNKYIRIYKPFDLSYSDISKKDLTVKGTIKLVYDKIITV